MWSFQRSEPRPRLTPEQLREAQFWYFWFMASLFLGLGSLTGGDEVQPRHRFTLLAFVLVYHLPELRTSLSLYRKIQISRTKGFQRRANWLGYVWQFITYLPLLALLALTHDRVWTWQQIGVSESVPWGRSFAAACLALLLYLWFVALANPRRSSAPPSDFERSTLRMSLPRGRWGQILGGLSMAVIIPVLEDLVYRGFLISYLGHISGSVPLGVACGLILFLAVHRYQGSQFLTQQLMWFGLSVALLLSPFGLLAVVMMHVMHNTYYVLTIFAARSRNVETVTAREARRQELVATRS